MRRKTAILLCIFWSLSIVGCDPVRTKRQIVKFRVVDSVSGSPVGGGLVQLKVDFDRGHAMAKTRWVDEQDRRDTREWWDKLPWITCVTDGEGQGEAAIVKTSIDRTIGRTPPRERDETGSPYLIKVKRAQGQEELLQLLLKVGEVAKGEHFSITVVQIDKPVYVAR
jgi:hypothetical protein